jgi:hypothetical protein
VTIFECEEQTEKERAVQDRLKKIIRKKGMRNIGDIDGEDILSDEDINGLVSEIQNESWQDQLNSSV